MASAVDICKRALEKLGAATITALSEDSREARACNRVYETVRDSLLRAHPWNFAIERTSLAAHTDAPAWGYARKYQLPSDCLKLVRIKDDPDYRLEGRYIHTDEAAPLYIAYIKRVEDPEQFDALFVEAFASRIAAELAEEITQSNTKKQTVIEDAKAAIREAKRVDAQENPPEDAGDTDWWDARL